MPKLKEFDLWTMDYVTDGFKTHTGLPFRTQRAVVGTAGNPAVNAVSGLLEYTPRSPGNPCAGMNDCVKPRKLICILANGESYGVPVSNPGLIKDAAQELVGAGCLCVHLEGEEITDPINNLFP